MAGLIVVGSWEFYLVGFGVSGSSLHIPGHPTSMCDIGVKGVYKESLHRKKVLLLVNEHGTPPPPSHTSRQVHIGTTRSLI